VQKIERLKTQIYSIISRLSEDRLIKLFRDAMIEDGYLSPNSRPVFSMHRNSHDWLKDWVNRNQESEEFLEKVLGDMRRKLD
jgi:hypothetical protein